MVQCRTDDCLSCMYLTQVMLLKIEVGKDESLADGIKAALRQSTVQHCEVKTMSPRLKRFMLLLTDIVVLYLHFDFLTHFLIIRSQSCWLKESKSRHLEAI